MNEIKNFSNPEFGNIRLVTLDGDPWFVGNDVASALGYGDANKSIEKIVRDVDVVPFGIDDGKNRYLISEVGVKDMTAQSDSPHADKLLPWLMSEYESGEKELKNKTGESDPMHGWKHVYAALFNDGSVKIGISGNVHKRILQLQSSSGKEAIDYLYSPQCSNAKEIEQFIHSHFTNRRIHGEWFDVGFEEAKECLMGSFGELAEFKKADTSSADAFCNGLKRFLLGADASQVFRPVSAVTQKGAQ